MDRIALVAGVGEGLGAALAQRFAAGGYRVGVVARTKARIERIAAGVGAFPLVADLSDEAAVIALFDEVESAHGPVEVAIFNAGGNYRASILDTPAQVFEERWRMACFAGFLFGREAARRMVPRGTGTLLVSGATASLRGAAQFAAFAAAKNGLRALTQSMARELGPRGIHVAHVVIDGMINSPAARARQPERFAALGEERTLSTAAIAEAYWQLHAQHRSAWSFELDLRPHLEKF